MTVGDQEALDVAAGAGCLVEECRLVLDLASVMARAGRYADALTFADRGLVLARQFRHPRRILDGLTLKAGAAIPVAHGLACAVPPPGFLNVDWRSGFADSNP